MDAIFHALDDLLLHFDAERADDMNGSLSFRFIES